MLRIELVPRDCGCVFFAGANVAVDPANVDRKGLASGDRVVSLGGRSTIERKDRPHDGGFIPAGLAAGFKRLRETGF